MVSRPSAPSSSDIPSFSALEALWRRTTTDALCSGPALDLARGLSFLASTLTFAIEPRRAEAVSSSYASVKQPKTVSWRWHASGSWERHNLQRGGWQQRKTES